MYSDTITTIKLITRFFVVKLIIYTSVQLHDHTKVGSFQKLGVLSHLKHLFKQGYSFIYNIIYAAHHTLISYKSNNYK